MIKQVWAAALACAATVAGAHPSVDKDDALSFVEVHYRDAAELQAIASQFQHVIVDRDTQTLRTEAAARDIAALRSVGIDVRIDAAATAQLRAIESALATRGSLKSIPGYSCYRTVEETHTTMAMLASSYPTLAQVADIGPSWQKTQNAATGYTMKVLKLTNQATDASLPNKPNMVLLGAIHAREYTTAELNTRFAEWLVQNYGSNAEATWLLDNYRFHLILQANPDGRKKAETGLSWRKNTNTSNGSCSTNAYGVDLNRNFPFHWNTVPGGSSANACVDTYHGPTSASEPETQNIVRYVAGTRAADGSYSGGVFADRRSDTSSSAAPADTSGIFMDIHSYSQLVLWPWGDTSTLAPNGPALRTLGRRLAWFNSYSPEQSSQLYATDGATDDTMYGLLGVPAFTLELGVAFFESCTTFQNATLPNNLAALRYAARNLQAPYQLPSGPDTVSVTSSAAAVAQGGSVTITASVDDSRFRQTNGTEATQTIASARMYVDKLPWQAGATPITMSAVDGSFNATSESVRATLSTAGLAVGRHLIYVQASDAAGVAGTPNAVLLNVTAAGANQAPVAAYSFSTSGLVASFIDGSTDPDGSIASRSWSFGDGSTSTATSPSKTYTAAGSYTVTLTVTDNQGATNSTSKTVTVSNTATNILSNGVPRTGLSGAKSAMQTFVITLPAGATNLRVTTASGTGDADLYVRLGSAPTTSSYTCRSNGATNTESCTIAAPSTGTYYVGVYGYSAYSGLTLTASYTP